MQGSTPPPRTPCQRAALRTSAVGPTGSAEVSSASAHR